MSLLRNVLGDLVAKRLWPVAVVLLAALVAVPSLLGGGGDAATTAPLPVTGDAGEGPQLLTLAQERSGLSTSTGKVDPFKRPAVPAANPSGIAAFGQVAAGTGAGAGGGSGSGSGPAGSTTSGGGAPVGGGSLDDAFGDLPGLDDIDVVPVGGSDGGSGSTGGDTGKAPKTPKGSSGTDAYRVDLDFGPAGAVKGRPNVPRLTPLPSAADPFFVFLGVLADGETALFLVSSDAEATGDGTCKPTPENCERIELQAGETEFFDFTTPDGKEVQYQLDLKAIVREQAPSAIAASVARSRESIRGRKLLRAAVAAKQVDVSDLAFSRELGLLVPTGGEAQEAPGGVFGGYRTDLRFGPGGADAEDLVKRYNLARLTPLPSTEDPSFVYLGVMDDGATALFLNPTGAAVSGDGTCKPTPETCTRVEVPAGKSATLDVPTLDGSTVEYGLVVDAISPVEADTPAEARRSRTRESAAGRTILRDLIAEVGMLVDDLTFDAAEGTVVDETAAAEAGE